MQAHLNIIVMTLMGIVVGIGGVIGARLVEHVSTAGFKKVFAVVLVGLAVYLFFKK